MSAAGTPMLTVRDLGVRFGGIVALKSVSFDVARGEICGVIGPNGAGKTTFFNCLSRLNPIPADSIRFDGVSLHDENGGGKLDHGSGGIVLLRAA